MDIGQIISKYIELRDRKAEKVKQQVEELRPINEAMEQIENWLMHQMNSAGVDQLKASNVGTAFKSHSTSCQMQDAVAFKHFIFAPATEAIINYLKAAGYGIRDIDAEVFSNIIRDQAAWDMVDFRAGKKGITEYLENEKRPVPGIAINTVATVNIRRA